MVLTGHIGPRRLVRTFVAVPTPEEIVRKLSKLTQKFVWPGCKVRWSAPEQFHLTVQFLGNVEWIEIGKIGKTLKEVAAGFGPIPLKISHLTVFPPRNQPRVVVAALEPHPQLLALAAALQERLQVAHQIVPEQRGYKPHITLGRVKSVADDAAGEALRAELAAVDPEVIAKWGVWEADELTFFQSNLDEGRAEYIELSHAQLAGGRADAGMDADDEAAEEADGEDGDGDDEGEFYSGEDDEEAGDGAGGASGASGAGLRGGAGGIGRLGQLGPGGAAGREKPAEGINLFEAVKAARKAKAAEQKRGGKGGKRGR